MEECDRVSGGLLLLFYFFLVFSIVAFSPLFLNLRMDQTTN